MINKVVVVGKGRIWVPESWDYEFPFSLQDGGTKTLALSPDNQHDREDTPGKGEFLVAQDSAKR